MDYNTFLSLWTMGYETLESAITRLFQFIDKDDRQFLPGWRF